MTGPIMIGKDKDAAKGALVAYTGPDAVGVVPPGPEGTVPVRDDSATFGYRHETAVTKENAARLLPTVPDLAEELGIGGSGVREVKGTVTLTDADPGLVEVYAETGATVQGVILSPGGWAVFRRVNGAWQVMVQGVDSTWRATTATTPTPPDPSGLVAPTLTITGTTTTGASVSWTAVAGAAGYMIRLNGGTWTDLGNVTTRSLMGLTSDTAYTVEVAAYPTGGTPLGAIGSGAFRTQAVAAPTTVTDLLDSASGTMLTAHSGGLTWLAPTNTQVGLNAIEAVLRTGVAMGPPTATNLDGGGRTVLGYRDAMIAVRYETAYNGTLPQIRLTVRSDSRVIFQGGNTRIDYGAPSMQFTSAALPATGVLAVSVVGSTLRAFINGAQVGSSVELASGTGNDWGFYAYAGLVVKQVQIIPATAATMPPALADQTPYTAGATICSDTFSGTSGTVDGRITDDALGGTGKALWKRMGSTEDLTIVDGNLTRTGTAFGGAILYPGTQDAVISATLAAVPVGGSLRVYVHKRPSGGAEGIYMNVSPTAVTPSQFGGAALSGATSFGAPQVGDVYTVKALGDKVTFSAKRADGTAMGADQVFTHSTYVNVHFPVALVADAATTAGAFADVIVRKS